MPNKNYLLVKSTIEHIGQTPCETLFYRVKAQRNEQLSEPNNRAVVYAGGSACAACSINNFFK